MNPYERFADPRATFVMIQVQVMGKDGRPSRPFALRISEEEFENMQASSRRQYERGQWPQPGMGYRYEPAQQYRPGYDGPFFDPRFTSPQDEYEHQRREYAKFKEDQRRREEEAKERKRREQEKQEYFNNFGSSAHDAGENFRNFHEQFKHAFTDAPPSNQTKSEKQLKERLAELAGSAWIETMSLKVLYNKAKRRCHPDMEGGSHELWIELEEIAHLLGIAVMKKPSRSR